ncbi:MAG: hypothetical protein IT281_05805 [Ignavibacteria bacterium]|nr:hypothetical protein [Ignavibacteria bacterium]MCC7159032.1 hypothetical protein [Ignavibacteria bacterium]
MRAGENKIIFTKEEAEVGREKIRQFKINVSKVITEEAWKHFPELSKLEIEKFVLFQEIVNHVSDELTFRINNLNGKTNRKTA